MQTPFKTIGIIGKPSDPGIAATLTALHVFLTQHSYTVIVAKDSADFIAQPAVNACATDTLGQHCDLVIAVGGDGTFLAAARAIVKYDIPLIGINLGRLGFLVDISPDELSDKLLYILQGHYTEEKRHLLRTKIIRDGQVIHEETAVNEVVIHRWVTPSMIEIITKIDNVFLNSQRSDGLIVSTPTGSTAYSLSAGGPILHPALNALVLVPLNPHTLSNRPIVINDSAEIEISFCQTKQINALVTCDHIEIPEVLISDKILIKKEQKPIRILHPEGHDFFYILRHKLNWSSGYHTENHAIEP
ncbi:MAG: NAD(+) kinase [Methylobacter sp.]|nr:NAD(+) kinase [Methylobacter sp.]MDP2097161.1 NAD(+) kinase [Methylobacter sp.]MDP2429572.1 NAD(+) kinase [Methylobacter sp.]MDP3054141.1 NAD(+) kinase [Methylobacter sp.]MDP3361236.1 NAD(+) kinase [Methylobacter sp.]